MRIKIVMKWYDIWSVYSMRYNSHGPSDPGRNLPPAGESHTKMKHGQCVLNAIWWAYHHSVMPFKSLLKWHLFRLPYSITHPHPSYTFFCFTIFFEILSSPIPYVLLNLTYMHTITSFLPHPHLKCKLQKDKAFL